MTTAKSEIQSALTLCNIQVVMMMVRGPKGMEGYDNKLKQFSVIITIIMVDFHFIHLQFICERISSL